MDLCQQGDSQPVIVWILGCENVSANAVFYAFVTVDGTTCQSANAATQPSTNRQISHSG